MVLNNLCIDQGLPTEWTLEIDFPNDLDGDFVVCGCEPSTIKFWSDPQRLVQKCLQPDLIWKQLFLATSAKWIIPTCLCVRLSDPIFLPHESNKHLRIAIQLDNLITG